MSDDKELPPSEKKLDKAREDSQDSQSSELTSLVTIMVMGGFFFVAGPRVAGLVHPLLRLEPLDLGHVSTLHERVAATLGAVTDAAKYGAVGLLAAALVSGLLGNLANRRRPPSLKMPELSYNPINTAKDMVKPSQILSTARLWLICVGVIAVTIFLCWRRLPEVVFGFFTGASTSVSLGIWLPMVVVPVTLLLMLASAIFDMVQKHLEFIKNNRMDHQEVKQENKESNGDPLIKSKRLELARDED